MTGEDFAIIMEKNCTDAMRQAQEIARLRAALEFYADPARWMKKHGVSEQIPDFYDETNFGERAFLALNGNQQ